MEGLGQLAQFILTGGQVHDVTQAQALIEPIQPEAVVADKAYDADTVVDCIERKNAKAVIPPKANRKEKREFDYSQYRNRNVIERFFARLKQFRRVATRYDKLASRFSLLASRFSLLASRFASFVALAASILWLK